MRVPRLRFSLRSSMAAIVVAALLTAGYVWILRSEPRLRQALADQVITELNARPTMPMPCSRGQLWSWSSVS